MSHLKWQYKNTMFEVVVNYVISLPRFDLKKKKLAMLKTRKGDLGKS